MKYASRHRPQTGQAAGRDRAASRYADDPARAPEYWDGFEFHKSAGGWDGHDYMGFVHGELIHRRMVNPNFAGLIYATRKSVAEAAPVTEPEAHTRNRLLQRPIHAGSGRGLSRRRTPRL